MMVKVHDLFKNNIIRRNVIWNYLFYLHV